MFWDGYVSNTAAGTSNNLILQFEGARTRTFRSYLKPLYYSDHNWRFWFSNTVDSTFADGAVSQANRPGGHWVIESAWIADGGAAVGEPLTHATPVLFGGRASKEVAPDEKFRSDDARLTIPENHYLVFTWAVTAAGAGDCVPMTPDSQIPCFTADGDLSAGIGNDGFSPDANCVKPNLFAVKKQTPRRLAFLGDSITQGIGTTPDGYEFWSAKIARGLRDRACAWNLGLGYARAEDAATGGAWLHKAGLCDEVILCLGVNDLLQGKDSGAQILANLKSTAAQLHRAGVESIIQLTLPPLDCLHERHADWKWLNDAIRAGLPHVGRVFDIASVLSYPPPEEYRSRYGGLHPDDTGGSAVAKAFLAWY